MASDSDIGRFQTHRNGFGFLRLLFAAFVIVSHTAEMAYGNTSHEPLVRLFGTISLGTLAVYGFFIVSGYLIVGSYLKDGRPGPYLMKRGLRIYPAFIVASLLCVFVVVPAGGGAWPSDLGNAGMMVVRLTLLQTPDTGEAFAGTFYRAVNGSLWSIAYEARCYLLVLAIGGAGLFRSRGFIALAAIACSFASLLPQEWWVGLDGIHALSLVMGLPSMTVRLVGLFLAGASFFLWRDRILYPAWAVVGGACALGMCLSVPSLVVPGTALMGSYLIFAFAQATGFGVLNAINNRNDISYGVYLYGWPIGKLLLWYAPGLYLPLNCLLTFALACLCGWLSWHGLEKPVMERLRVRAKASTRRVAVSA